jgi:hypothetical protein
MTPIKTATMARYERSSRLRRLMVKSEAKRDR